MKLSARMLVLFVAIQAPAASAQMMTQTFPAQNSAFPIEPVIRITSAFRVGVSVTEGQSVPNMAAQETARRELYAMAAKECAVLSETFKADCRLGSVSTFTPTPPPNASPASSPVALGSINATANYELRLRVGAQ